MHPLELLADLSFAGSALFGLGCGFFVLRKLGAQLSRSRPTKEEQMLRKMEKVLPAALAVSESVSASYEEIAKQLLWSSQGAVAPKRDLERERDFENVLDTLLQFGSMSLTELGSACNIDESRLRQIINELAARKRVKVTASRELLDEMVTVRLGPLAVVH